MFLKFLVFRRKLLIIHNYHWEKEEKRLNNGIIGPEHQEMMQSLLEIDTPKQRTQHCYSVGTVQWWAGLTLRELKDCLWWSTFSLPSIFEDNQSTICEKEGIIANTIEKGKRKKEKGKRAPTKISYSINWKHSSQIVPSPGQTYHWIEKFLKHP